MEKLKLDEILKDEAFRRFIEDNYEVLRDLANIGHGEINCPIKEGKILANRKKLIIEHS